MLQNIIQGIMAFSKDNSNGKSYITTIKKDIGFDNALNAFNLKRYNRISNVKFSNMANVSFPMRYHEYYYGGYTENQIPLGKKSKTINSFSGGIDNE